MKTLVSAAIALHALGMIGGVYFVFATKSWLARLVPAESALMVVSVLVAILWVGSGVLLLGGAWGFYGGTSWFRPWLIAGAALSIVGIALWAGRIPVGTYVGGLLCVGILVWQIFFPQAL